MSAKNSGDRQQKSKPNPKIKSSIVHKPFATGKVNFFNPHRTKSAQLNNLDSSNNSHTQLTPPKLFLNAELEESPNLPIEPIEAHDRHWVSIFLNPWSISAIAMIFFVNLISGAVIWRNYHFAADARATGTKPLASFGSANLADGEFVPLNLATLSRLKTAEDVVEESSSSSITPISPALAPINHTVALSSTDSEYHYVLSEYTGERSLALARQKVPQVSLVNFPQGVFIYLGAFRDRDQAEEFVSQLMQEGFATQIYPFD